MALMLVALSSCAKFWITSKIHFCIYLAVTVHIAMLQLLPVYILIPMQHRYFLKTKPKSSMFVESIFSLHHYTATPLLGVVTGISEHTSDHRGSRRHGWNRFQTLTHGKIWYKKLLFSLMVSYYLTVSKPKTIITLNWWRFWKPFPVLTY